MFNKTTANITIDFENLKNTIIQEIKLKELNDTANQFVTIVQDFNSDVSADIPDIISELVVIQTKVNDIKELLNNPSVCTQQVESICTTLRGILEIVDSQIAAISDIGNAIPVSTIELEKLQDIFDEVEGALISADISTVFGNITDQISEVKKALSDEADSLIGPIQDNIGDIFSETGSLVDDMKSVRDEIFPYFKTATLVLGSFFVVVLVVFFLGALCGSCSKRGGQSASGAATLLFSTNIVLILLAVLLFLLTTGMFIVGALSQKLLCKTLDDPANSELLTFASPLISEELAAVYGNDAVNIDVAEIIEGIHNGTALYPLLQLNYIYDINNLTDWKAQFHVDEAIDDGRQLVLDVIEKLETYKVEFEGESGQIANFADLVDTVIDNLMQLNGTTDMGTIITDLQGIGGNIPGLETQIGSLVTSLQTIQANVESTIASFNVWYTSNYVDFLNNGTVKEKTEETLDLIADAFDLLMNETSPNYIPTFFNDSIIDPILGVVDNYVDFAITEATTNIGETSPLSNIYDATYTDICHEIVNPFNAGGILKIKEKNHSS